MKSIKIDFCGFWGSFKKNDNLFVKILQRHFIVQISDDPDFVICSNRGDPFEYMKYDCVRIMFMGENLSPDFTVFDYVIGFDYIAFSDRYFRLPFAFFFDDAKPWIPEVITYERAVEILKNKEYFCNFIYGHRSSHGLREKLFDVISKEYKNVISPGRYLNNTGTKGCSWAEKHRILEKSKFTIACDSISYPGFVTEKIVDPFRYHSVPVYYGSTTIKTDFNEAAFIACENEDDIERVLEEVKKYDQNDEEYIKMLMECPFNDRDKLVKLYAELEAFLVNIFSKQKDEAMCRVRYFCAENHEKNLDKRRKSYQRVPKFLRK